MYRERFHYTQDELSQMLYVERQTISLWETGKTEPCFDILIELSVIFDIPIQSLFLKHENGGEKNVKIIEQPDRKIIRKKIRK